ncbi:hypothetical protein [Patulibacter sp. SYSU D01012]|uniref:hypothetical protein n=1 Tax=Patulibacter sp. SYSU D01012 TaxID=2817381 RepID=UPI001B3110BB|nr:hypothetical protein [Patulibacter sp. SYSU D01012]
MGGPDGEGDGTPPGPLLSRVEVVTPGGPAAVARDGHRWGPVDGPAVGGLDDALRAALPEPADAALAAVHAALAGDGGQAAFRRALVVRRAEPGEARFHLSARRNRDSIAAHGLDWRRMRPPGIAGSTGPEAHGIFLCDEDGVGFFRMVSDEDPDVWRVEVGGLWLHSDASSSTGLDDAWAISARPIAAGRLTLCGDAPIRSA